MSHSSVIRILAALTTAVSLIGGGDAAAQLRDDAPSQSTIDHRCAVLELTLHAPDSLSVVAVEPTCGAVRVVVAGPARDLPLPPGTYLPRRDFQVPIALENAGDRPLSSPVELRVDSISIVHGGRPHDGGVLAFDFWVGREMQQPWRFGRVAVAGADRAGAAPSESLPSGARSDTVTMRLSAHPLMRTVRVWLDVRGQRPLGLGRAEPPRPALKPTVVDAAIADLVAAMRLPAHQEPRVFRDSAHRLSLFTVDYGPPRDCPAGCLYSRAIGIAYEGRVGWLRLDDYDGDEALRLRVDAHRFAPTRSEAERLATWLLDTPGTPFGPDDALAGGALLPVVLESPHVPWRLLRHLVDRQYRQFSGAMVSRLLGTPAVRRDGELLTDLVLLTVASHPRPERDSAHAALRALAPTLLRSSTTSPWTLFVLALSASEWREGRGLADMIANHPGARNDPATLTVLAEAYPHLRQRAIASVRGTPRVRALLAEQFERVTPTLARVRESGVLADPDIRRNADALLVLANLRLYRDQELVWAASRLLPESARRRWELPRVPVHALDLAGPAHETSR